MTITKDILTELGIANFSVIYNDKSFFCMPLNISGNQWTVAIDGDFTIEGNVTLRISTDKGLLHFPGYMDIVHTGPDTFCTCVHRITVSFYSTEPEVTDFLNALRDIEKQKLKWNKRKEERYAIGEKKELIGFDKAEQKIKWMGKTLPCFIYNVSYGGSQVITVCEAFQSGQQLEASYTFVMPPQMVDIAAVIRHVDTVVKQDGKLRFSVLNLQFPEPPIIWMQRIEKMSKIYPKGDDDICLDF